MPDIDCFVQMAFVTKPLREPVLRSAIRALQFPSGSRGHTSCALLAGSVTQAWRNARPEPLQAMPMPQWLMIFAAP